MVDIKGTPLPAIKQQVKDHQTLTIIYACVAALCLVIGTLLLWILWKKVPFLKWGVFVSCLSLSITFLVLCILTIQKVNFWKKVLQAKSQYQLSTSEGSLKDSTKNANDDLGEEMFDQDEIVAEMYKCLLKPVDGVCPKDTILEGECCQIDEKTAKASSKEKIKTMISQGVSTLTVAIVGGEILETMIKMMVKGSSKFLKSSFAKLSSKFGKSTASKMFSRSFGATSVNFMMRGRNVIATKLSTKLSTTTFKILKVGNVLLVVDILGMVLDAVDPEGYNLYTSNEINELIRNKIEYMTKIGLEEKGLEYPLPFLFAISHAEKKDEVMQNLQAIMFLQTFAEMIKSKKNRELLVYLFKKQMEHASKKALAEESGEKVEDLSIIKIVQEDDFPNEIMEEITKNFEKKFKSMSAAEIDKLFFDIAVNVLDNDPECDSSHIMYEPSLAKDGIVSRSVVLSEKGAKAWNEAHRQIWWDNNDATNSQLQKDQSDPNYKNPPYALFTNKYRLPKANTSPNRPEMETKTFPKKVTWFTQLGMVYAYCEKPRSGQEASAGSVLGGTTSIATVDPKEFGVSFDKNTGTCNYTKEYCKKMVLQYTDRAEGGDCEPAAGQDAWETIIGKTYTRYLYRTLGIEDDEEAQAVVGAVGQSASNLADVTVGQEADKAANAFETIGNAFTGGAEAIFDAKTKWSCKVRDMKECYGHKSWADGKCYKDMFSNDLSKTCMNIDDSLVNKHIDRDGFCHIKGICKDYDSACLTYTRC